MKHSALPETYSLTAYMNINHLSFRTRDITLPLPALYENPLQSHNSAARIDSLSLHIHINQNGLPHALDLGNDTFEIKCFGKHNFEDLLNVYRRGR
jgi:hypothetical protein